MTIRVEVRNEILGNSIFWEGTKDEVPEIRNIVARALAKHTAEDGISREDGMWFVSVIKD